MSKKIKPLSDAKPLKEGMYLRAVRRYTGECYVEFIKIIGVPSTEAMCNSRKKRHAEWTVKTVADYGTRTRYMLDIGMNHDFNDIRLFKYSMKAAAHLRRLTSNPRAFVELLNPLYRNEDAYRALLAREADTRDSFAGVVENVIFTKETV